MLLRCTTPAGGNLPDNLPLPNFANVQLGPPSWLQLSIPHPATDGAGMMVVVLRCSPGGGVTAEASELLVEAPTDGATLAAFATAVEKVVSASLSIPLALAYALKAGGL